MIAIFLLLVVMLDTAITGFLLAKVRSQQEQIVTLSGIVKDISEDCGDGE